MAVKVGGVQLDIATNVAKVRTDFDQIKGNLNKFSRDAKKILGTIGISLGAIFSVRAIKNFIVENVKLIDGLQDMAQAAGMGAREFQGLVHQASYADVEATKVTAAVRRLNTNILDANHGLAESQRIFNDLNVEYRTAKGEMRDTSDVLRDISDRFRDMKDGGLKSALATKALGRSGSELIPILNQGSDELDRVTDRLERMGGVIDDETLEAIDKVNQNIKDMSAAIKGIKLNLLAGMADELKNITTAAVDNYKAVSIIKDLGNWMGKLAVVVASAAAAMAGLVHIGWKLQAIVGGLLVGGPMKLFDIENIKEEGKELAKTAAIWAKMIKDMWAPAGDGGERKTEIEQGGEIVSILDTQASLIQRIIKDSKSKGALLLEEKGILKDIQEYILAQSVRTKDMTTTYHAIAARIKEIEAEMKKMATMDTWGNMKIAALEYYTEALDKSKQVQDATTRGFKTMEDSLVQGVMRMKMEWRDLADSIISDITRILIRQRLILPLMGSLGLGAGTTGPQSAGPVAAGSVPTGGAGRRRGGAYANLSNDLATTTTENTALMIRQVDDFVKHSERQFDDLGKSLRRNLSLRGTAGLTTGEGMPLPGTTGGGGATTGAAPGGVVSGVAVSKPGMEPVIDLSTPVGAVQEAVKKPSGENILDAIVETNIMTVATKTVGKALDKVKKVFGFHRGGDVGLSGSTASIPRYHNGLNSPGLRSNERLGILEVGERVIPKNEAGRGGVTINIPVSIPERNPALAARLRDQIEKTVLEVMRQYA